MLGKVKKRVLQNPLSGIDPRYLQILFLSALCIFGVWHREFPIAPSKVFYLFFTGLLVQAIGVMLWGLPVRSLLSALISCCSVLLLLRSESTVLLCLAAMLSIASKFVFRFSGKHIFNPSNFGIVAVLFLSDKAWVSSGQWGTGVLLAAWCVALGLLVSGFVGRRDMGLAFLGCYALLILYRVVTLGLPLQVLFHELQNGSLLIFCFYMLTDPRSTPDAPIARILFAWGVATLGYWIRFEMFQPNALLLALFFLSPITPLLDRLWKSKRFSWGVENRETGWGSVRSHLSYFLGYCRECLRLLWVLRRQS